MICPDQRSMWDAEYAKKGRLWGNAPLLLGTHNSHGRILDLGCGDGKNLRTREKTGQIPVGIDFSMNALLLCRKDPVCRNSALICADGVAIPFKAEAFDEIHLHHLIGHLLLPERARVAQEVIRILKPGGTLLVTAFGEGDMRERKGKKVEEGTCLRGQGIITHYFSIPELSRLFTGLSPLRLEEQSWEMRTGKTTHIRREIVGVFHKPVT